MSDDEDKNVFSKMEGVCSENGVTCRVMEASEAGSIPMEQMKTVGLKPEDDDESDDDDDEEEEEEDLPLGLLEQPLVLPNGKREKKKVERLEISTTLPSSVERRKMEIEDGPGEKLGDCPRIEFRLCRRRANDLKPLHRTLFLRAGSSIEVKRNIRQFSGFTFARKDDQFVKRLVQLTKINLSSLKLMCEVLDIERGGTKSAVVERILLFLMKPESSGLKVPQKRKKLSKSGAVGGGKRTKTKLKSGGKATVKKHGDGLPMASDEAAGVLEGGDDGTVNQPARRKRKSAVVSSSSEEEDGAAKGKVAEKKSRKMAKPAGDVGGRPPIKKRISAMSSRKSPKITKQNGPDRITAIKKKKKQPLNKHTSRIHADLQDSDVDDNECSDDDSDDEPLAILRDEPPANSQLREVIRAFLDGANLEEVTMKTVVRQVYEKYSTFDLTDRKDFIKATVREIIS